jgi:hypothetical protein
MDSTLHTVIADACANNGALLEHWIAWIAGISTVASLIANLRNRIPAPVLTVIDTLALNFVKQAAEDAAPKGN